MSDTQSREQHGEGTFRYSPERAYRPLVSPPSVEDKDACAIYASVRRDATPSHEPIERAIPALQKMLHRAGNVDGEDHPAPAGTFASIEPPATRTILNRSEAPITAMVIGVKPDGGYEPMTWG